MDSNQHLPVYKTGLYQVKLQRQLVSVVGFEPTSSCFQNRPSGQTDLHTGYCLYSSFLRNMVTKSAWGDKSKSSMSTSKD